MLHFDRFRWANTRSGLCIVWISLCSVLMSPISWILRSSLQDRDVIRESAEGCRVYVVTILLLKLIHENWTNNQLLLKFYLQDAYIFNLIFFYRKISNFTLIIWEILNLKSDISSCRHDENVPRYDFVFYLNIQFWIFFDNLDFSEYVIQFSLWPRSFSNEKYDVKNVTFEK